MSILTCTNVHPDNEVSTIDKTYLSWNEIKEYKEKYPAFANYHPMSEDEYNNALAGNSDCFIHPYFFKNKFQEQFTFNCSGGTGCMRWWEIEFTNVKTGKKRTTYSLYNHTLVQGDEIYNGDTKNSRNHGFTNFANNGEDWQMQIIMFQSNSQKLGMINEEPLFDMKLARGKFLDVSDNDNYVISKNIDKLINATYLYEPTDSSGTIDYSQTKWVDGKYVDDHNISSNNLWLIGGAVLEVENCRLLVQWYDKTTGEICLHTISGLNGYDVDTSQIGITVADEETKTEGTQYTIYTNYFYDKPRYVMTRSQPDVTFNVSTLNPYINSELKIKDYGTYQINYQYEENSYTCGTVIDSGLSSLPSKDVINSCLDNFTPNSFDCIALHCNGYYKQNQTTFEKQDNGVHKKVNNYRFNNYVGLKCYQYLLYKVVNGKEELFKQSDKIYSADLTYDFYIPISSLDNSTYKVVLRIETIDNAVYDYRNYDSNGNEISIKNFIPSNESYDLFYSGLEAIKQVTCSLANDKSYCKLNISFNSDFYEFGEVDSTTYYNRYIVYRQEKIDDTNWGDWQLIFTKNPTQQGTLKNDFIKDYLVGSGVEFRYMIIPIDILCTSELFDGVNINTYNGWSNYKTFNYKFYTPYITETFKFNWTGSVISSLDKVADNKYSKTTYTIGDTWNFEVSPNSNDISTNIGSYLYEGTNSMPTVTRNDKEYESSTFTLDLMQFECPNGIVKDDIKYVKKWVNFITGQNDFLLKTPKGDVWIVEITNDNPSRNYSFGSEIISTNITYSWVQVQNNDNISFRWW